MGHKIFLLFFLSQSVSCIPVPTLLEKNSACESWPANENYFMEIIIHDNLLGISVGTNKISGWPMDEQPSGYSYHVNIFGIQSYS